MTAKNISRRVCPLLPWHYRQLEHPAPVWDNSSTGAGGREQLRARPARTLNSSLVHLWTLSPVVSIWGLWFPAGAIRNAGCWLPGMLGLLRSDLCLPAHLRLPQDATVTSLICFWDSSGDGGTSNAVLSTASWQQPAAQRRQRHGAVSRCHAGCSSVTQAEPGQLAVVWRLHCFPVHAMSVRSFPAQCFVLALPCCKLRTFYPQPSQAVLYLAANTQNLYIQED